MNVKNLVLVTLILIASNNLILANADVPNVLELSVEKNGDQILVIKVRHSSPSSSHYIDKIQIELDGELVEATDLDPQTDTQFTEQYTLESESENIRVRAHCNLHGWSNWDSLEMEEESEPQGIPGFPVASIILGTILALVIFWFRK